MFEYRVEAVMPSRESAREYVAWLTNGHVAAVVRCGAISGEVVVAETVGPPLIVSRYLFPSRASFEAYELGPAVALRAEGAARFGPATGIRFSRSTGTVAYVASPSGAPVPQSAAG